VTGTWLNVGGILLGGGLGLLWRRNLPSTWQHRLRLALVTVTLLVGFGMVWDGLRGPLGHAVRQLFIALMALMLGSLTGRLLRLQKGLVQFAGWAGRKEGEGVGSPLPDHFAGAAVYFAANPLGLVGALTEGATGDWRPLALKAALDGLAALGFSLTLGRSVLLLAVPVLAIQGTLTLAVRLGREALARPEIAASLGITGGFIVVCASVALLGVRRVPLADYLPALIYAPFFTALWR
jgi:uncharacterized membrane protein YqgA involved in biofilm formation